MAKTKAGSQPHFTVTAHALMRYLERELDIDMSIVERKILEICKPAMQAGAASLHRDGLTFLFNGCTVATVIKGQTIDRLDMDHRRYWLDRSKRG